MTVKDGRKTELTLGKVADMGAGGPTSDLQKVATASLEAARVARGTVARDLKSGIKIATMTTKEKKNAIPTEHPLAELAVVYAAYKGSLNRKRQLELARLLKSLTFAAPDVTDIRMITKAHARKWRDARRQAVSIESVVRECNVIKSIFSIYINERDLNIANPFVGLPIQEASAGRTAMEKRLPLSISEIHLIREKIYDSCRNVEVGYIWDVLALTGARGAEIQGLKCSDVYLQHAIPHLRIETSDGRSVKSDESIRWIPLYGLAYDAVQNALRKNYSTGHLFGRLGKVGYTNISNVIMKQVRKVTADKRKVGHSLRHSIVDLLRENNIPKEVSYPFTGHASSEISEKVYGSREKQLYKTNEIIKGMMERYSQSIAAKT
ncbi:integrase family protein [Paracoccus nototheniae]|nr:tyrosine-type recombinase/integrase [Paracoccus nototheniae]